jgi:hypothetical protein
VVGEPGAGVGGCPLKRARLFEQVGCAGNDYDPALTAHERLGPPVELRADVMGVGALRQHLPPDDEDLGEVDVVPVDGRWRVTRNREVALPPPGPGTKEETCLRAP